MKIGGLNKLTLLDYPNNVACIIFTKGCNFKCPYCHNSPLLESKEITKEEIFDYLNKRKGILDGVTITGGEPLIYKEIKEFIKKIKDLGYKVKLDTNGSNPKLLKELIDENLIDYIAMDIKNTYDKYDITSGVKVNTKNIKESIKIIENSKKEYEFRTTIVKELHTIKDIETILTYINKKSKYYIQNFIASSGVLKKELHGFTEEELTKMRNKLQKTNKNIEFRDL